LAAKLEKVTERLQADAPNMRRPGAGLIADYLDPDRLPVKDVWSRKHAGTQPRLCRRFAAPVTATATYQDIQADHRGSLSTPRLQPERRLGPPKPRTNAYSP
jgi:hypothetical protein